MAQRPSDVCVACRAPADTDHEPDCANRPMSKAELDRMFRQRSRKATVQTVKGREVVLALWVAAGEDLLTVLESPLKAPVENLLDHLSTLVAMTSALKAAQTDREGSRTASSSGPSLIPVWAERRLDQVARRISEDAEAIAAWLHNPDDPNRHTELCRACGWRRERGDLYCPSCGEPSLTAFRRCGVTGCGQRRMDCRHTGADVAKQLTG